LGWGASGLGPEAMPELLLFGLIVLHWLLFSVIEACWLVILGSVLVASNVHYIRLGSH
jgi:hypothetical protein